MEQTKNSEGRWLFFHCSSADPLQKRKPGKVNIAVEVEVLKKKQYKSRNGEKVITLQL